MPYLAAGAVSLIGGAIQNKGWSDSTVRSLIGTVVLVIVASATASTRFAPLVRAIGFLLLLTSVMAAVRATQTKAKK